MEELKEKIKQLIAPNGKNAITAQVLQNVLFEIVDLNTQIGDIDAELIKIAGGELKLSGLYTSYTEEGRKVNKADSTYNSVIVYIPKECTTFYYDGFIPGSIDGFSKYPKIGDYAEIKCYKNNDNSITIPNNENGWYILIDIVLGNQSSLFKPFVYIKDTLTEKVKQLEDSKLNSISRIYNIPVNLKEEELKILFIGNSYTMGMLSCIRDLCSNLGNNTDNIAIYRTYQGSSSFSSWVSNYDNDNNVSCSKVVGGLMDNANIEGDNIPFRQILSQNWDIIFIQQSSSYAVDYKLWIKKNEESGNLVRLIQILKMTNPQSSIGYVMPHSYADNYSGNSEKSSQLRWKRIAEATKELKMNFDINFIIPYGTAVENLRSTSLNANDFSTDGTHIASGLGHYVSSCCCYEMILAPRFGNSMFGNTLRYPDAVNPVTDENAEIAQKMALNACCDMFNINTD